MSKSTEAVAVPPQFEFIERWFSGAELNGRYNFDNTTDGLEAFWKWVTARRVVEVPGPAALQKAPKFFRGQTKSWHGFTSSLYRVCKQELKNERIDEYHLAMAERAVIDSLRSEGIGRRMTAGELLMVCQHHLVPTRLIDVSMEPLEALFFATEKEDGTDGRLFVVAPHTDGSGLPNAEPPMRLSGASPEAPEDGSPALPWSSMVRGTRQSKNMWSTEVRLVDEMPLDPRMRAQAGKFLVGGVHRAYGGMNMPGVSAEQRPDISSLAINFHPRVSDGPISSAWGASGWSVRIHAAWKRKLRDRLSGLVSEDSPNGIAHDSMYPPVDQIERLGKYVAKSAARESKASASVPASEGAH